MPALSFDEATHRYLVDGIPATSVSRIAAAVTGKSFAGVNPEILEAARIRGEAIHSEVETGSLMFSESMWIAEQVNLSQCEHEIKVGGCIAGKLIAGRLDIHHVDGSALLDIKTGSTKDVLYWAIQLNLYRELLYQSTGVMVDQLRVLWTPKTGKYKLEEVPVFTKRKLEKVVEAFTSNQVLGKDFLDELSYETRHFIVTSSAEKLDILVKYMDVLGIEHKEE